MNGVFVRGWGAVSPAGWGSAPLLSALAGNEPLPTVEWPGPRGTPAGFARPVPASATRLACQSHPRLRRASAISQFAVAAGIEALEGARRAEGDRTHLGIVVATHAAPIRYSERFYGEVLRDPGTASPILFPETVINAPASHLAACLGGAPLAYTVTADQTAFVQALSIVSGWLLDRKVEVGLVVGTEEVAWPVVDALRLFARGLVASEGAGALVLAREPGDQPAVVLERITDAFDYAGAQERREAARAMRAELPPGTPEELSVDSRCGVSRVDGAESAAWRDWPGKRLSPRAILGEGLNAATAWQFIAACDAIASGQAPAANVSVVGGNLQAIGARLTRR